MVRPAKPVCEVVVLPRPSVAVCVVMPVAVRARVKEPVMPLWSLCVVTKPSTTRAVDARVEVEMVSLCSRAMVLSLI